MNIGDLDITYFAVGDTQALKVCLGAEQVWPTGPAPEPVYSAMPLTFEILSGGNITLSKVSAQYLPYDIFFEYQVNRGNWVTFDAEYDNPPVIPVNAGDEVRIVCTQGNGWYFNTSSGGYWTFGTSTAGFNIKGNILSLVTPQYATINTFANAGPVSGYSYTFQSLFASCTTINSAEHLVLPIDTTPYCYHEMFLNSSLAVVPHVLPAAVLSEGCYRNLFAYCSNIYTVPADLLAATSGGSVPNKALNYMFRETNITVAPDLPAATLTNYACRYMFYNCRNLNYVKCLATTLMQNCTDSWLYGVSPTGTFVRSPGPVSWSRGESGIPTGWTVEDYSPNNN